MRGSERGSSTRNIFALRDWLLSNPPWDLCVLKITRDELPMDTAYGIGCVWGMPSLSPLSSLGLSYPASNFVAVFRCSNEP